MRKSFTLLASVVFCTLLLPAIVFGQGNSTQVIHPDHFDKTSRPLREMFERGDKPEPARAAAARAYRSRARRSSSTLWPTVSCTA
jgi:hypothetical protein